MKKLLTVLVLLFLAAIPSGAVFNERDLSLTLRVLRYELERASSEIEAGQKRFIISDAKQHKELVDLMDRCNELSLMLYSQKQNFTFDLTYALQQVTDQYRSFNERRMPFDEIIEYLEIEIDRYARLVKSLRLLPPAISPTQEVFDDALLDSLSGNLRKYIQSSEQLWSLTIDSSGVARGPQPVQPLPDASQAGLSDGLPPSGGNVFGGPGWSDEEGKTRVDEDVHHHGGGQAQESRVFQSDSTSAARMDLWHDHEAYILDSLSAADRDSCLVYATEILGMLIDSKEHITQDSGDYNRTNLRLKEFFDYAQDRYSLVQKNLFLKGQEKYWNVLKNLGTYSSMAFKDAADKYGRSGHPGLESEWRGPLVIGFPFTVLVYLLLIGLLSSLVIKSLAKRFKALKTPSFRKRQQAWHITVSLMVFIVGLTIARAFADKSYFFSMASSLLCGFLLLALVVLVSVLARSRDLRTNDTISLYTPVLTLGLLVITCRIIFIPNSLLTLLAPPVFLAFTLWQLVALRRLSERPARIDKILAGLSLAVMGVSEILSLTGYVLLGLQVYIWWIFQLAAVLFVHTCEGLMRRHPKDKVDKLVEKYRKRMGFFDTRKKGSLVEVTWAYDLVLMVLVPQLYILTFPASIFWSSGVFDLTTVAMKVFHIPFLNASFIHLSFAKLILVAGLYFLFSYLSYLVRGLYRVGRFKAAMRQTGADFVQENEVNLTLANNILGILVWGIYAITAIAVLKIPTKSLSVVTAGLAAGIGFAMKDILNNFFYGVQLMSGRLKTGDWIECDGVRGEVDKISYQSTQIVAIDGSVMEFPNSALFSKNFRNLTRNNNYEHVALPIGVAYGTDIGKVRSVLVEALSELRKSDKYGRQVVDPSYGVKVVVSGFGDSSVDLLVKQYILVEQRTAYTASANEIIYNALNTNNIEIPFPQRDINIRHLPATKTTETND